MSIWAMIEILGDIGVFWKGNLDLLYLNIIIQENG
jgi:hypothetical protein